MDKRRPLMIVLALLAVAALACGEDAETTGEQQPNAAEQKPVSLSVQKPADGASVSVPFELSYSTSVPLGAPETGRHHVHIWYDGNDDEYEVVNANRFSVSELSSGDHTITVSLRNADHSSAGADDQVKVRVTGGGGTGGGERQEETGYEY